MRLCLVVPGFSAGPGDWCIPLLSTLVRALATVHEVEVVTLRHPRRRGSYDFFGARVTSLGGGRVSGVGRFGLLWRACRWIGGRHRRRPFDVVHGFWCNEPGAVAGTTGRLLGIPSVASVMGGELVGLRSIRYGDQLFPIPRGLVRTALATCDRVTAPTEAAVGWLRRRMAPHRVTTLPLPVDTNRFRPAGPGVPLGGSPALLSVGSLLPVKNPLFLLDVIDHLRRHRPQARLHVVGDGPLRGALEAGIRRRGLDAAVTLHGQLPYPRMAALYRGADRLVVASLHEGCCMAAIEAAACGCEVVGPAVGILPALAAAGRATIRPLRPEAFVEALAIEPLRRPESPAPDARVAERYGLDRFVERLGRLYAGLPRRHRR